MRIPSYSEIAASMRTGDMIEWADASILGEIIRGVTRKHVNHTSMVVCLPYGNLKYIVEANPSGVQFRPLEAVLGAFKGEAFWSPLKPEFEMSRSAMAEYALKQVDKSYDYGSLFRNVLGRVSANARRFFCSELYFMALRAAGLVDGTEAPRPGEFGKFRLHLVETQFKP